MPEPKEHQIQIRIPEETLKGHYANIMRVDMTREEFIFDFGTINPAQGNGIITDRIFMNPSHVKRMINVLQQVMANYEKAHGTVTSAETTAKEIGFQT